MDYQLIMGKLEEYLTPEPIKGSVFPGWINLYLFAIQGMSGLLLLFYYRPTVSEAYESVLQITHLFNYGWLVRGVHFWAAHLLFVFALIHIILILITRGYYLIPKITWVLGASLLPVIGLMAATGHLLPWTQTSYWSTTFITQIPTAIPFLGEAIKILSRGGEEISQLTLSRFFVFHIFILPILFLGLARFHIISVKKSLLPKDLLSHLLVILILIGLLFTLSTVIPFKASLRADPLKTSLEIKPAWYFLASYEIFHLIDTLPFPWPMIRTILALFMQAFVYFAFLLLPFFIGPAFGQKSYWNIMVTISGVSLFFLLTFLGYY